MRGVVLSMCCVFVVACSHAPKPTDGPTLGFGDFVEQVLMPLAKERTEEVLALEKARIEAQRSRISLTALGAATGAAIGAYSAVVGTGVGAAVGGAIGKVIDQKWEADRKQALAHAEAQRIPFQQRLLDLFTERTAVEDSIYSFCAMGKQRRYEPRGARFKRLKDDPNVTCPIQATPLYSRSSEGNATPPQTLANP